MATRYGYPRYGLYKKIKWNGVPVDTGQLAVYIRDMERG